MAELVRRTPDQSSNNPSLNYPAATNTSYAYPWGTTANGSAYLTDPLVNYAAYSSEKWLDEYFGIAGWSLGAAVRGLSSQPGGQAITLTDGTKVAASTGSGITSTGTYNGTNLVANVAVQWDLGARQATIGTPEWARKILADNAPIDTSTEIGQWQVAYPSVEAKREFFGEPAKSSYSSSTLGSRIVGTQLGTVDSFTENGKTFYTLTENVSGSGIPSYSEYSRIAPLGSELASKGGFFSPTYSISSSGQIDSFDKAFEVDRFNTLYSDTGINVNANELASIVNDIKNTYNLWGSSAGASALQKAATNYYSPVETPKYTTSFTTNAYGNTFVVKTPTVYDSFSYKSYLGGNLKVSVAPLWR